MLHLLTRTIDRLSGATGLIGACLVLPLAGVMFYEVVLRFFFDLPTFWAYELAYMMTGAHFALGIAYVMREGQHIRIDFIYARFRPRTQAAIDLGVNVALLLPVVGWLSWALLRMAVTAFLNQEVSGESAWNPVVWPLYSVVVFGFLVFTLQIIAEAIKSARVLLGAKPNAETQC